MWCRYGTLQEVVQRVVLNMLIYTELLCAPCRHGGARRSGEGAGYQGVAGHRGWARKCASGLEVGISKEFCIFVGYITCIVYKY